MADTQPGDVVRIDLGGPALVRVSWVTLGGRMVALEPDVEGVRYFVRDELELLEVIRLQRNAGAQDDSAAGGCPIAGGDR